MRWQLLIKCYTCVRVPYLHNYGFSKYTIKTQVMSTTCQHHYLYIWLKHSPSHFQRALHWITAHLYKHLFMQAGRRPQCKIIATEASLRVVSSPNHWSLDFLLERCVMTAAENPGTVQLARRGGEETMLCFVDVGCTTPLAVQPRIISTTDAPTRDWTCQGCAWASSVLVGVLVQASHVVFLLHPRNCEIVSLQSCNHSEADTRIVLNLAHATEPGHTTAYICTVNIDMVVADMFFVSQSHLPKLHCSSMHSEHYTILYWSQPPRSNKKQEHQWVGC